ncbi:hypothetical protein GEMRC1_001445 [Eukaryota sp. GEM-RC1]
MSSLSNICSKQQYKLADNAKMKLTTYKLSALFGGVSSSETPETDDGTSKPSPEKDTRSSRANSASRKRRSQKVAPLAKRKACLE